MAWALLSRTKSRAVIYPNELVLRACLVENLRVLAACKSTRNLTKNCCLLGYEIGWVDVSHASIGIKTNGIGIAVACNFNP